MQTVANSSFSYSKSSAIGCECWIRFPIPRFDPIYDCFSQSMVMKILSVNEAHYEKMRNSNVLPCSYFISSCLKLDISTHTFFDIVQVEAYQHFSKLKLGHEIEIEMARLFTDIFADCIDKNDSSHFVLININYLSPRVIDFEGFKWEIDPSQDHELEKILKALIYRIYTIVKSINDQVL